MSEEEEDSLDSWRPDWMEERQQNKLKEREKT